MSQRPPTALPYINATIISVTEEVGAAARKGSDDTAPWPVPAPAGLQQGQVQARVQRRHDPFLLVTAFLLLLIAIMVVWYADIGSVLLAFLSSPQATITIIPRAEQRQETVSVTAVTGQPAANQVAAHHLQGTSPISTVIARATGLGQTPGSTSHGMLIFYNQGPSPQTIAAGQQLRGADGIVVITDAFVTVPAGNPPSLGQAVVSAHSMATGSQANIAAGDIGELCCASGISVKNAAFEGGQDGQTYPVLEQRDIDAAAVSVAPGRILAAQRLVEAQVSGSEHLLGDPECYTSTSAASPPGSQVVQVAVRIWATCIGAAYDRASARRLATSLFVQEEEQQIGLTYTLASRIATQVVQVKLIDTRQGTFLVRIQAQGTWRYHFSRDQQQAIARRIAGKPVAQALTLIAEEQGVEHTSVSVAGEEQRIPTDLSRITIAILPTSGGPAS